VEEQLEHGFWRGELWSLRKNGELYLEFLTVSAVRDTSGPPPIMWACSATSPRPRSRRKSWTTWRTTIR
jgi:hypothetical protein